MWFDQVLARQDCKEMFLEVLKSSAAVALMNNIIYGFGDTMVWKEIPIDSDEARLCWLFFNQGMLATITFKVYDSAQARGVSLYVEGNDGSK